MNSSGSPASSCSPCCPGIHAKNTYTKARGSVQTSSIDTELMMVLANINPTQLLFSRPILFCLFYVCLVLSVSCGWLLSHISFFFCLALFVCLFKLRVCLSCILIPCLMSNACYSTVTRMGDSFSAMDNALVYEKEAFLLFALYALLNQFGMVYILSEWNGMGTDRRANSHNSAGEGSRCYSTSQGSWTKKCPVKTSSAPAQELVNRKSILLLADLESAFWAFPRQAVRLLQAIACHNFPRPAKRQFRNRLVNSDWRRQEHNAQTGVPRAFPSQCKKEHYSCTSPYQALAWLDFD